MMSGRQPLAMKGGRGTVFSPTSRRLSVSKLARMIKDSRWAYPTMALQERSRPAKPTRKFRLKKSS